MARATLQKIFTLKKGVWLTATILTISGIKSAFGLAYTEGEQLKISVDNVFPLLKAIGLNPQSESVVDLVREASIESKYNRWPS